MHKERPDKDFKEAEPKLQWFYVLLLSILDFVVLKEFLMLIGFEVGDGELHELQDNVLESSLSLELTLDILPAFSSAVSHKVQKFYIVFEPPV